jgi:hypothetical protein
MCVASACETFANAQHAGISNEDADDLCDLLDRRAADPDGQRRQI